LTAEDLLGLPNDGLRHEIVTGYLLSEPPASFDHGMVAANLHRALLLFVEARGLGSILSADTGFLLARSPDTVRAPDVAFLSKGRIQASAGVTGFFPGAPDLAVEVLSPSDRPDRAHGKVADYLAAGARMVWIVDPARKSVIVHGSLLSPRVLGPSDTLEGGDLLPGFTIPVAALFDRGL
jgi:Uma2 family endonuclease